MPISKQAKRALTPQTPLPGPTAPQSPPYTPEHPPEKRARFDSQTYRSSLEGMRDQQRTCKLFNALVDDPAAVIETMKFGKNNLRVAIKNVPNVKNDDLITFVGPIWEHDMRMEMPKVPPSSH
jgi:hypothetical protein